MAIHVKTHRRGKSVVRAHQRSTLAYSKKVKRLFTKAYNKALNSKDPSKFLRRVEFLLDAGMENASKKEKKIANGVLLRRPKL